MANPHRKAPEGSRPAFSKDEQLQILEEKKRELCADFRRKLSHLLDLERSVLGLVETQHEIEIYY